jgi:uncharacterized membrane protein YdjX (TVP38/TMEM64 family)
MSHVAVAAKRKSLLIKLAVVAFVGTAVGVLLLRGVDLRGLIERVLTWIRSIGPFPFFVAMAVLPAFGFPLLAFTLSAGPVFAPQLGLGLVIFLTAVSVAANIALTYWLARYALRPFLTGLLRKFGYQLPQVAAEDYRSLTILVRVTPGPPFFVQGYLLGLAGVPFRIYLVVSLLIAVPQAIALILFGDALAQGKGKITMLALSLVVALSVGVQWLRRRYARKAKAATAIGEGNEA